MRNFTSNNHANYTLSDNKQTYKINFLINFTPWKLTNDL